MHLSVFGTWLVFVVRRFEPIELPFQRNIWHIVVPMIPPLLLDQLGGGQDPVWTRR